MALRMQQLDIKLSNLPYEVADRSRKKSISVRNIEETIEKLINSDVSISRFGDGEMDPDSKFNFFHDLVDTLSDYAPDLYDKLVAHCEEKAKKEFELAFDYWVNNKEKYDYYEDEEI